ncbi:alcohol oxidase [Flagelloscypha sp. PMI_526]|nr:alcohol oxidase [Flagelloscypha sp. PMI_526]
MPLPLDILNTNFDYVIIGGGTAGLTAAQRIADDESLNVLIIEAGDDFNGDGMITRPGQHGAHFGKPEYDWGFKTVPQTNMDGRQLIWPRGKGLGGSSAINFFIWTIPEREDVNDWERLGNEGWNFERFIKYAHKNVKFSPGGQQPEGVDVSSWPEGSSIFFSLFETPVDDTAKDGTLEISWVKVVTEVELKFREVLRRRPDIPLAKNPLSGDLTGIAFSPSTIQYDKSERSYAGQIFLDYHADRNNLRVLKRAHASRIVFAEEPSQDLLVATGIEFLYEGATHVVKVGKEVILCAGTLNTPHILELSGIGRSRVLDPLGIPVKVDLPVGENVQDHLMVALSWELEDQTTLTSDVLREGVDAYNEQLKLYLRGEGAFNLGVSTYVYLPFATISPKNASLVHEAAFERIKKLLTGGDVEPGVATSLRMQIEKLKRGALECEFGIYQGYLGPFTEGKFIFPRRAKDMLLSSASMTNCGAAEHAISKDPLVPPTLDPNYFQDPADITLLRHLVRFVRELAEEEPFKSTLAHNSENPGPSVQSDAEIDDWIRKCVNSGSRYAIGSASMLPREKGGVVDNRLKVYGTSNLRVADLSILPTHISNHTQSSAYMIGEFVADVIKGIV